RIHNKKALASIPKNLPIFIIAGEADPVGAYTKTIKKLINVYKNNGHSTVEYIFYPGGRHELLNEKNRNEVMNDILKWVKKLPS
ncbi:MAG TPA: alpha/beta hydrolase, partial [Treponemataceae bacterium]|nr:alpha/beta hydrolase [Treponemataceae bacterium]